MNRFMLVLCIIVLAVSACTPRPEPEVRVRASLEEELNVELPTDITDFEITETALYDTSSTWWVRFQGSSDVIEAFLDDLNIELTEAEVIPHYPTATFGPYTSPPIWWYNEFDETVVYQYGESELTGDTHIEAYVNQLDDSIWVLRLLVNYL